MHSFVSHWRCTLAVAFSLLWLSTPAFAQTEPPELLPDYEVFTDTLSNGLRVVICPDTEAPQVFGALAFRAGGKTDYPDATGMAHYLEHMLFKGTDRIGTLNWPEEQVYQQRIDSLYGALAQTNDPTERRLIQRRINEATIAAAQYIVPQEFDQLANALGANTVNAFTSYDETAYYSNFAPAELERWLALNAERMRNPVFRLFQPELETVYEEKNRWSDSFIGPLQAAVFQELFRKHPYGQQTILGKTEHLKNPPLPRMQEYFDTYYVPNNAVLLLVGNVNPTRAMPQIEKHFSFWQRDTVPEFHLPIEDPFRGREEKTVRFSPIKMQLMAWRGVPFGHPDKPTLEVLRYLLQNDVGSGLVDSLVREGHLLAGEVQLVGNSLQDYGVEGAFVVPPIISLGGLKKAEERVLAVYEQIKQGKFTRAQLQAAKNHWLVDQLETMEQLQERALLVGQYYLYGMSWSDFQQEAARVDALTRQELMAVAQQYFGPNYLVFISRRGKPPKDQLPQPPLQPVEVKNKTNSPYGKEFLNSARVSPADIEPIEWQEAVTRLTLAGGHELHYAENPENGRFELEIRYRLGTRREPALELLASYLNNCGTADYTPQELKEAFFTLGAGYSFEAESDYFVVELEGLERHFEAATGLLTQLLFRPKADKQAWKTARKGIQTGRRLERENLQGVAFHLMRYALRGEKAPAAARISKKDMRRTKPEELLALWQEVRAHSALYFYTGRRSAPAIREVLLKKLNPQPVEAPASYPPPLAFELPAEPTVFFHPMKKSRQAHIVAILPGDTLNDTALAVIPMLSEYLSGPVMFRELREFRSLGYAATAGFFLPEQLQQPMVGVGYVASQVDKAPRSLKVMQQLLDSLPQNSYLWSSLQQTYLNRLQCNRPNFRELPMQLLEWQHYGYRTDPRHGWGRHIATMEYEEMIAHWETWFRNGRPVHWAILGDPDILTPELLSRFGRVIEVKRKTFMRK